MKHFNEYTSTEWDDVADYGMEVFLVHEDVEGGAIHGHIVGVEANEVVLIRRVGTGQVARLRAGLIGTWYAQVL